MFYLLVCITGILLFILVALYPLQTSLSQLDEDIAGIKAFIEEQKALSPLYKELLAKVQEDHSEISFSSKRTGLSIDQVDGLSILFKRIAQSCNLEAISVTPDPKSLAQNPQFISVYVIIKGNFLKLRKFLFELERLPFMEHIGEMQVQEAFGGKAFRFKIWLAVNSQQSKNK